MFCSFLLHHVEYFTPGLLASSPHVVDFLQHDYTQSVARHRRWLHGEPSLSWHLKTLCRKITLLLGSRSSLFFLIDVLAILRGFIDRMLKSP